MSCVVIIFVVLGLLLGLGITLFSKLFVSKGDPLAEKIESYLPQIQCGQCGYPGCKPYAEALSKGDAINKCIPGGQELVEQLSELLSVPVPEGTIDDKPDLVAIISEDYCIGCTKCIQACPVDAIIGSRKRMHVIIPDICTGCELCLPPCPTNCIDLVNRPKKKARSLYKNLNLEHLIDINNIKIDPL